MHRLLILFLTLAVICITVMSHYASLVRVLIKLVIMPEFKIKGKL